MFINNFFFSGFSSPLINTQNVRSNMEFKKKVWYSFAGSVSCIRVKKLYPEQNNW